MKIRKELWFGFILMALIIAGTAVMLLATDKIETGHLGLMMLALVVVAIMLGFPTAFTLMGMGMIFTWLAYERDGGTVAMTHTIVPPPIEGRGVAAQLTRTAVDWAKGEGLQIDPQCSYVRAWLRRNA